MILVCLFCRVSTPEEQLQLQSPQYQPLKDDQLKRIFSSVATSYETSNQFLERVEAQMLSAGIVHVNFLRLMSTLDTDSTANAKNIEERTEKNHRTLQRFFQSYLFLQAQTVDREEFKCNTFLVTHYTSLCY